MIFKSIKWRLQIWYGLILVVVLAGFGFTALQLERGHQLRQIDDELHRRFESLARALHPLPPARRQPPFPRPPPEQIPNGHPPAQNFPAPPFQLPPQAAALFGTNSPDNFYFIIKRGDREIARSDNVPPREAAFQTRFNAALAPTPPSPSDRRPVPRASLHFKDNRAIVQRLSSGETILVGCSVAPELRELKLAAWRLAGVGAVILIFGLAGGWWIATRTLRPIAEISFAATRISAGDLSQRISAADAETELGQLAAVLNSTFARLEAAFAQQQQFTADAAHELRTPVSVMLTRTQTALSRERTAAEYRETIEVCQRATQRMRRLIESLLELARLDAGQEQMKRMPFDLSRLAAECVELIRPLADERGVKIHCDLPPCICVGDSERLALVISNLLTNGIQYNREHGEVRISAQSQTGMAVLVVADTGKGIAEADLPRVFERFYRADKSRSSTHTGLGLAICKAIVEAHSGTIEVASEENAGATFTVRLPVN